MGHEIQPQSRKKPPSPSPDRGRLSHHPEPTSGWHLPTPTDVAALQGYVLTSRKEGTGPRYPPVPAVLFALPGAREEQVRARTGPRQAAAASLVLGMPGKSPGGILQCPATAYSTEYEDMYWKGRTHARLRPLHHLLVMVRGRRR